MSDVVMTDEELFEAAGRAAITGIDVNTEGDGIRLSWDDNDPLGFMWQTKAQARDLAEKLLKIAGACDTDRNGEADETPQAAQPEG